MPFGAPSIDTSARGSVRSFGRCVRSAVGPRFDPGGSAGGAVSRVDSGGGPPSQPDQSGVRFVAREGAKIGRSGAAVAGLVRLCGSGESHNWRGMTVDHSVTMRSTYERINEGDLDGFGELVADDYVEHQGGLGFPPTKEGMLEFFGRF